MSRFANLSSNDYYRNGGNNVNTNNRGRQSNRINERMGSHNKLYESLSLKKKVDKAPSITSAEFPHLSTGTFIKHEDNTSTEFLTKILTDTPEQPIKKEPINENTNFMNLPGWAVITGTGEKNIIDNSTYDDYQDKIRQPLLISALKKLYIKNNHNHVRLNNCTLDGVVNYAYVLPNMNDKEYETYVAPDHEIFVDSIYKHKIEEETEYEYENDQDEHIE